MSDTFIVVSTCFLGFIVYVFVFKAALKFKMNTNLYLLLLAYFISPISFEITFQIFIYILFQTYAKKPQLDVIIYWWILIKILLMMVYFLMDLSSGESSGFGSDAAGFSMVSGKDFIFQIVYQMVVLLLTIIVFFIHENKMIIMNKKTAICVTLCFVLLLINCKSDKMEKEYIWMVSADAAKGFPATFHYGYLGDTGIRGGGILGYGWGLGGTLTGSISEKRPLPKQLDLVWMSYVENQFYEGHFELDHKKIATIFEKGYKNNTDKGVVMDHEFTFRINVAPGGTVAIWLMGQYGFQREVGFYQAKKTSVVWREFVPTGLQDRALYVKETLEEELTKKQLEKYQSEGIPYEKWKNYRQQFEWKVSIEGSSRVIFLNSETFNGEQYTLKDVFLDIDNNVIKAALPKELGMQWEEDPAKEEMFTASLKIKENDFKKLTRLFKENNSKGHFVITPYMAKNVKKVRLFLVTGTKKEELELEENTVRHFPDYYKNK